MIQMPPFFFVTAAYMQLLRRLNTCVKTRCKRIQNFWSKDSQVADGLAATPTCEIRIMSNVQLGLEFPSSLVNPESCTPYTDAIKVC